MDRNTAYLKTTGKPTTRHVNRETDYDCESKQVNRLADWHMGRKCVNCLVRRLDTNKETYEWLEKQLLTVRNHENQLAGMQV